MSQDNSLKKIRCEKLQDGAILRVTLDHPKGNVLDSQMTRELIETFKEIGEDTALKAVVMVGAGDHFCFGASVEEHRPAQVESMLSGFHELFREISRSGVVVLAAVRGMCLGGGLELAAYCQRIFASHDARLGQPEIALGVFAPVASAILTERVGRAAAEDLLLTGRTVKAGEAHAMRLVDQLEEDPEAAAIAWAKEYLLPHSATSLRFATRAARVDFMQRFEAQIVALERLYLHELMNTADAVEGIEAFLEKRVPVWKNR